MSRVGADAIAVPVLDRLGAGSTGMVRGIGSAAAYVDFDGYVVAITAPDVAAMPNGISVASMRALYRVRPGTRAELRPTEMVIGGATVDWSRARRWVPSVPANLRCTRAEVGARGRALARVAADSLGEGSRRPVAHLGRALRERDLERWRSTALELLGWGPGLTPEGDDILVGGAAAMVAWGAAIGFEAADRRAWLAVLHPSDLRTRTTALAATLLELACEGFVAEPLGTALDLHRSADWRAAAAALTRVGHSTGRAWLTGCAVVATSLASTAGIRLAASG
jgi:hypothetical protein